MKRSFVLCLTILILIFSCTPKKTTRFKTVPGAHSGITFENTLNPTPELNILTYLYYYNGAGVSVADLNNDSLPDLYFSSNEGNDKLYLNKGNLQFQDISEQARIHDQKTWSTGVTHVDINADGLLDIYVCKAAGYRALNGKNRLYINQGTDENNIPTFKEDAASYGIDFSGLSTQAAFFDYDLDGDLDLFLLNHSVHPNNAYGYGTQREKFDPRSGDRLFRNDQQEFVDVSQEAGLFQGRIGFGLGLAISDLNQDGYPDIYIGNDFYENDYLYVNQKDGTFQEIISKRPEKVGHTSHYAMGNDIADINNDGLTDILSVDMLPRNQETYKTSGLDFPYPIYENYLKNGYAPQYMQNSLLLNLGNTNFSEVGHLTGLSASEWSWGVLLADFDNDGLKDAYISNGIKGATNNMDFVQFISNDIIQKGIDNGMSQKDMSLIDKLPEIKEPNYLYRNLGNLEFKDVTNEWSTPEASYSNGCVYSDLDNDGDLDLVINNVNAPATLLENTTVSDNKSSNYLSLSFKGNPQNPFGIGARIIAYGDTLSITQENFTTRGYLSAVAPELHIGLGQQQSIDSLKVIWPSGVFQTLKNIAVNQKIVLDHDNAKGDFYAKQTAPISYLKNVDSIFTYTHKDPATTEFLRNPIVPWANTNAGPHISVSDINNDALEDLFISGAKGQASQLLLQKEQGSFTSVQSSLFAEDSKSEDVSHVFFDANGDTAPDLIVVSGGNEFQKGTPLRPRLYLNYNGQFEKDTTQFKEITLNASKVAAVDFDNDGDMDVTISADQIPLEFGKTARQYILQNDGTGNFKDITETLLKDYRSIGNVKDFVWADIDNNGYKDLIMVGHWMSVTVYKNNGKALERAEMNGLIASNGLWNTIKAGDFDNDGDIDFVCGNWGLNSKLHASKNKPLTLYRYDFDTNGAIDPVVTYFHDNIETPFASKDELVKQMPYLNKQYLSYGDFAKASLADLFTKEKLLKSEKKEVYELAHTYFQNNGENGFSKTVLPRIAQISTIHDIAMEDFNKDGFKDLLIVGNSHEISTQLGRMDALHGLILLNHENGSFQQAPKQNFDIPGPARSIERIKVKDIEYYLVGMNDNVPIVLKKKEAHQ